MYRLKKLSLFLVTSAIIFLTACGKNELDKPVSNNAEVTESDVKTWTPEEIESIAFDRFLRATEPGTILHLGEGTFKLFQVPEGFGIIGAGIDVTMIVKDLGDYGLQLYSHESAEIIARGFSMKITPATDEVQYPETTLLSMVGPAVVEQLRLEGGAMALNGGLVANRIADLTIIDSPKSALTLSTCDADSVFERIKIEGTQDGFDLQIYNYTGGIFRELDLSENADGAIALSGEYAIPEFINLDPMIRNDILYEDGAIPRSSISEEDKLHLSYGPDGEDESGFYSPRARIEELIREARPLRREATRKLIAEWKQTQTSDERASLLLEYTNTLTGSVDWVIQINDRDVDQALRSEFASFLATEGPSETAKFWKQLPESPTGLEGFFFDLLTEDEKSQVVAALRALDSDTSENAFADYDAAIASEANAEVLAPLFFEGTKAHYAIMSADPTLPVIGSATFYTQTGQPVIQRFTDFSEQSDIQSIATILAAFPATAQDNAPGRRFFVGLLQPSQRGLALKALRDLSE